MKKYFNSIMILITSALIFSGCAATPTPPSTSYTRTLEPDQEDNIGGSFLESNDIRTIAYEITNSLLTTPEISGNDDIVRIAIAPIKNSSRYIIDKNIFMKRLRIELNKVAKGQVRFYSQNVGQSTRKEILQEQDEEEWDLLIDEIANYIGDSNLVKDSIRPLKVAVIPVKNTNIVGLNAESFTSLTRSRISEKSKGRIIFLAREENGRVIEQILDESDLRNLGLVESRSNNSISSVDYFFGGEFIAKSLSTQSVIDNIKAEVGPSEEDPGVIEAKGGISKEEPNVTKYLNVMLIDAQTGEIPLEKTVKVERKMQSGLGNASYLLTGELSALSKAAAGGDRSDYVILSFQLVEPRTNEVLWEDAYETKKVTNRSVLYK